MKVVINRSFGGFGLSDAAVAWLQARGVTASTYSHAGYSCRHDPLLVACVEALGNAANNSYAELHVIDMPDDVSWYIEQYDGKAWIAENHGTWS